MARIMIVEDEPAIADLLNMHLKLAGHERIMAYDGASALDALTRVTPDLILLDAMLPGVDGFSVMERIAHRAIPVIFLTAKSSLPDKVRALSLGADDYIVKPFEAPELLLRIGAVLRRTQPAETRVVRIGNAEVRLDEHVVLVSGQAIELTAKEFSLLEVLIRNRNIALSRDRLLELVWGYDYCGETRTVDVHVQRLRAKLNFEDRIKTVYKVGYRLEVGG